jgi:hypothetical protein
VLRWLGIFARGCAVQLSLVCQLATVPGESPATPIERFGRSKLASEHDGQRAAVLTGKHLKCSCFEISSRPLKARDCKLIRLPIGMLALQKSVCLLRSSTPISLPQCQLAWVLPCVPRSRVIVGQPIGQQPSVCCSKAWYPRVDRHTPASQLARLRPGTVVRFGAGLRQRRQRKSSARASRYPHACQFAHVLECSCALLRSGLASWQLVRPHDATTHRTVGRPCSLASVQAG